ncbi:MAG: TonB-dependent receptor [Deltaproteobacteria bacterium]|jgi:vitamin B12 transporter|nr:TonB-dependent receptor [Deltaproteobacteria bacterium]
MRKTGPFCILLPLFLALPGQALSQDQDKTQTLEPVVVTAGRVAEKAKNVTASMTVIPQEEIKKNQYRDLGGLLRNYGVQIDDYTSANSGLSQISIRGIRSSAMGSDLQGSVLVLADGRRIGTDNIAMIPLVNIERIEIIRGPAAVQYGTSAMGGVINVITRRGTETLSASAEAGVGSWETYQGQAGVAWAKGPVDFSGGVSYLGADEYYTGGGHRYANTGLNYKTAYNANAGFNFLEEHRIGVTVLGVRADDMGSPGYFNDLQHDDYTARSNYSVDLGYEGGYKPSGLSWKARYFAGKNDYTSDRHADSTGMYYFKSYTDYQGTQVQASFAKSILTLTGGADWLNYDTSSQGYYYPIHENSSYDNLGLFMLAKLSLFDDRLIFSGGLRYDDYTLKVRGGNTDKDMNHTTPSAGVAWHATDWLTLRGNYGESYRIPDAVGLVGFSGMFTYIGNPGLKPEEGKSVDAGFEIDHKHLNLGLTYFQADYKNKIVTGYTPSWDIQYDNLDGVVRLRGIEGTASYDLGAALDWPVRLRPYVRFTRMTERGNKTARRNTDGNTVLNVSDLDLAYGLNFQYPEFGFEADVRFTYYGRQKMTDFNAANPTNGQVVSIGGATTADLFMSQRISAWDDAGTLSVNAAIRNIFDEKYALVKDYWQPGRSFYLGLRYDY